MITRIGMAAILFGVYINSGTISDGLDLEQISEPNSSIIYNTLTDFLSNYSIIAAQSQAPGLLMPSVDSAKLSLFEHIAIGFIESAGLYLCAPFNAIGYLVCSLITGGIGANEHNLKSFNTDFCIKFLLNSVMLITASIFPTVAVIVTCLGFMANALLFILYIAMEALNCHDWVSKWFGDSNSIWKSLKRNLIFLGGMLIYLSIYVILSFMLTCVGLFIANSILLGLINFGISKALEKFTY